MSDREESPSGSERESEAAGARGLESETRAYRVEGRVQGVGFRWWTRRAAAELGLSGSVQNSPDGSVEILAVGSRSALADLEDALSVGPVFARVDDVVRIAADELPSGADVVVRFP
jgi:acylphosphatase